LRECCRQANRWQAMFPQEPPLFISVNVSGKLFMQPDAVERLVAILEDSRLPPASLRLEVTENVVVDHGDEVMTKLTRLRALGVQLSIDDFGTGYSSLSYLQRFQYDSLKIDRSFVSTMGLTRDSRNIVKTILNLADDLGIGVVAEGVETEEQAIRLRPKNAANYLALGNAHLRAGRFKEAVDTYARGLAIQPDNLWLKSNLAVAYDYSGEPRKAMAVYESVAEPDATMLSNLSTLYFIEGRYQEAAELLRRALVLEPRSVVKHGNLGDTYRRLGLAKEAADEYRSASGLAREQLDVDDRNAVLLARLAVFEAKLGQSAQALQDVRRAVALAPDDNAVLYKRAVVHALLRQRDDAVEWLGRAIEKGYSRARVREDLDLESIRKLPQVEALLRKE